MSYRKELVRAMAIGLCVGRGWSADEVNGADMTDAEKIMNSMAEGFSKTPNPKSTKTTKGGKR